MNIWSCHLYERRIGSKPEQILRNAKAAIADSTPVNEANCVAQFSPVRGVDELLRDNLIVLPEHALDKHVENELYHEWIHKEVHVSENEWSRESGYPGPTNNDAGRLIREALVERDEDRIRRFIDNGCEKLVLPLFREAPERVMDDVHTPFYEVMEQAAVKAFFIQWSDELFDKGL